MTSQQTLHDITLALAGIFQAASIVRDLAKTGTADELAYNTSINSIYKIDAANLIDIYGGSKNLRSGLQELIRLMDHGKLSADPYTSRYVISLISLERKLVRNKTIVDTLARRIKHAVSQANYFSSTHPTVITSLADIYVNTIGSLSVRLHVLGQAKYLNQAEMINKVRAVLLAGIRSVVLWRQLGGSRWQLFFWRSKLVKTAKEILGNH